MDALVDKMGAITYWPGMFHSSRVFFVRPRRFGTTLTQSITHDMLAAGCLHFLAYVKNNAWRGTCQWPMDARFGKL